MRIDGTPPLRRTASRRDGEKTDAGDKFAAALTGESHAAPVPPSPTLGPIDGLFSIQEIPDPLAGRRRAILRGDNLLDQLDALRLGMLAGVLPRSRLDELARFVRTARDGVDDPGLSAILDEIDLRAAVELAKLDAGL